MHIGDWHGRLVQPSAVLIEKQINIPGNLPFAPQQRRNRFPGQPIGIMEMLETSIVHGLGSLLGLFNGVGLDPIDPDNAHAHVGARETVDQRSLNRVRAFDAVPARRGDHGDKPGFPLVGIKMVLQRLQRIHHGQRVNRFADTLFHPFIFRPCALYRPL